MVGGSDLDTGLWLGHEWSRDLDTALWLAMYKVWAMLKMRGLVSSQSSAQFAQNVVTSSETESERQPIRA